jgi:hypothetical protein
MVTVESLQELREIADLLTEEAGALSKDNSRLIAGWQRVDNDAMKQLIQSFYHMGWNLADLRDNMQEITGMVPVHEQSTIDDIRFADHHQLNRTMLIGRTKNWFAAAKKLHHNLSRVVAILDSLEARPYRISFVMSRIYLDLDFLKMQYEQATGEKLED